MSNVDFDFDFDLAELGIEPQPHEVGQAMIEAEDIEPPHDAERLISVHAVGQYAFCPRSAILALETGDETDIDEPLPRLDYLPNFDLERIEEELSKWLGRLGRLSVFGAGAGVLAVAGAWQQERLVFYPALAVFLGCALGIFVVFEAVSILIARRWAARHAKVREPSPFIDEIEPVNWWEMLKARFDSVSYQRPFRHPILPLEGSPWRVLERGSLRIPVIRSGGEQLGPKPNRVYAKHEARLAAYAVLLEATEHVESPYGLVFPVESHIGLAVPLPKWKKEYVWELVEEIRQTLRQSQNGQSELRLPENQRLCKNCCHGAPEPLTAGEAAELQDTGKLLVLEDQDGRSFHCACGDRFGSAPPHGKSIQLGLVTRLG